MILHTGQVLKHADWTEKRENYIRSMRHQIHTSAANRDLVIVGPEMIEIIEIRHNGTGWVSAKGANITHVKVTIEQEVEHA